MASTSIYMGTALQPTRINLCVFGNFLTMTEQQVVFVRDNRLEVCSYMSMALPPLKVLKETNLNCRIICACEIKLTPTSELSSLAVLTSKDQLYIYSFLPDGSATMSAHCKLQTGTGLLKSNSTAILMAPLERNAVVIHNIPGCLEIVEWDVSENGQLSFEVRPYRRDNAAYHMTKVLNTDNHFAVIEREGNSFNCRILSESSTINRLDVILGPVEVGSDIMQLIPLNRGVLAVSATRYSFILEKITEENPNGITRYNPVVGRSKAFAAHCPLDVDNRWLIIEDTGDIYVLAMDFDESFNVDLQLDYVGMGPCPDRVTKLCDGHFFVCGQGGDHNLIRITQSEINGFEVLVNQVFHHMGPILDMVTIENRSETKLVTASGASKHGSFRTVKNCISVRLLGCHKQVIAIPKAFSLTFLDAPTSLFALGLENKTGFIQVDHELNTSKFYDNEDNLKVPGFGSIEHTFYVGVIEPSFYIQMRRKENGIITCANSGTVIAELPKASCGHATRYGEIVLAINNRVEWYYFDSIERNLVFTASQEFPVSIHNVTFADPEDKNCHICFVYLHQKKTFLLIDYERKVFVDSKETQISLKLIAKLSISKSKVAVDAALANFNTDQSYAVIAVDDGSIEFFKINLKTGVVGPRETLNIGIRPPKFCKTYVHGQLHLLMCSDQTTAMRCDRKSVTFCNVDIKEVGFVLPLGISSLPEKNNQVIYQLDDSIVLGSFVNKQRMTTQTIPIEETVDQFIYNKVLNIIIASTNRVDTIIVRKNASEIVSPEETVCSRFPFPKDVLPPLVKPEFTYPPSIHGVKTVYGERRFSLSVFCADRIHLLDVLKMQRFEEITALTTGTIRDSEYLLVATQFLTPGQEHSDNCRILIYRLDDVSRSDTPSVLTYLVDRPLRTRIFAATFVDDRFCVFTESNSLEFYYSVDNNTVEQINGVHVGHFIHVASAVYSDQGQRLAVSDIVSSTALVNNCASKWGRPSVIRHKEVRCLTALNFATEDLVIGVDSQYLLSTIECTQENVDREELNLKSNFYMGDIVNAIRYGIPFLPSYAQPKGLTTFQRTWCTTGGGVGVFIGINSDVFKFLKAVECALDKAINLPSTQIQYREGTMPYSDCNVVDGDFLQNLLDFENPDDIMNDIEVPQSLRNKNPDVSPGLLAFFYMKLLSAFH